MDSRSILFIGFCLLLLSGSTVISIDYKNALSKSLAYFEAQRSGILPPNQRVTWRGNSGLNDGKDIGVDLVGGYYDAGDNVKFGFPMAFTVTMLAWSVIEYGSNLAKHNELSNALAAIKWGTDYFIKTHPKPNVLYGEVGDGASDHACWQRPEDMTTPRTPYMINEQNPGSDLAAETAAAFAAAAIAFRKTDPHYSNILIRHAKQLFEFARSHPGQYHHSIQPASVYYPSSGFEDELLWAAVWLERATESNDYTTYITQNQNSGGTRSMFSWDDKYIGAQLLIAKNSAHYKSRKLDFLKLPEYQNEAEQYICNCIGKGNNNVQRTNGGLLWWQPWDNLQYVTSALFVSTVYSDYLTASKLNLNCQSGVVTPQDLLHFVQSQVDYILGSNPRNMSYMVGFGSYYPRNIHHRGASIVSIKKDNTEVTCSGGFDTWFNRMSPNPNVLDGAIVGGPDLQDSYSDSRPNYQQAEPATANTAPLVAVLARLASSAF